MSLNLHSRSKKVFCNRSYFYNQVFFQTNESNDKVSVWRSLGKILKVNKRSQNWFKRLKVVVWLTYQQNTNSYAEHVQASFHTQ